MAAYSTMESGYKSLNFSDDFMFGMVLMNRPDICKDLAELITGRKISHIGNLSKQYTVQMLKNGKGVRFDVYFEDDADTAYDFEMQTARNKNLPKRTRYYQSLLDAQHMKKGSDYADLQDSYIVFICLEDPFHDSRYMYTFENRCLENGQALGDGAFKIFLNADGIPRGTEPKGLVPFLEYVKSHVASDALTRKIEEEVQAARDDAMREVLYMTLRERDDQMRELGEKEGMEKGIEKGIKKGMEKGALFEKKNIAKNLLRDGRMTNESIASLCGLPLEEVQALQNAMS